MDTKLMEISEQLQENIQIYFDGYDMPDSMLVDLCDIVYKTIYEKSK
jgi:hypothetical protein